MTKMPLNALDVGLNVGGGEAQRGRVDFSLSVRFVVLCWLTFQFSSPASSTMPTTSREELRASITRHNATFENLLRLIPPEFYFERESDPDQVCNSWSAR